ncbi:MAG: four-carbon acid sugar kinase family protein [Pseudomonadota bacterium]|nr:four-carbon acid sugar kinase family protein [Pseudomonadota bacterium]
MDNRPQTLGIIADDLSGAIECAALCRRVGHSAAVFPHLPEEELSATSHTSVIVAVTDSRHLPKKQAASRVHTAARWLYASGIRVFYKKTDSAARGPIGAELAALATFEPARDVFFVPAFPRLGRTVTDGVLSIDGVPVAETAFANDPRSPVTTSSLVQLLAQQCELPIVQTPTGNRRPPTIVVCDGTNEAQVTSTVATAFRRGAHLAGPAGALESLLRLLALPQVAPETLSVDIQSTCMLIVAGSCHPVTWEQVNHIQAHGAQVIHLDHNHCLDEDLVEDTIDYTTHITKDAWKKHQPVVICSARGTQDVETTLSAAAARGLDVDACTERITQRIAEISIQTLNRSGGKLLIICGGATSQAMIDALHIDRLELLQEIEPGIGLCRSNAGQLLITKNGAFGKVDALTQLCYTTGV